MFKILSVGGVDDGVGFSAWLRSVFLQYTVGTTGTEGSLCNYGDTVLELATRGSRPSGHTRIRYLGESICKYASGYFIDYYLLENILHRE